MGDTATQRPRNQFTRSEPVWVTRHVKHRRATFQCDIKPGWSALWWI